MTSTFKNYRIRRSYRQPPSLLHQLRNNNRKTLIGVTKCGDSRCECCNCLIEGTTLFYKINGEMKSFEIRSNMNCNTKDLIYAMKCGGCGELYVGQTGDIFRSRVRVHRQQVRENKYAILHASKHISACAKMKIPHSGLCQYLNYRMEVTEA